MVQMVWLFPDRFVARGLLRRIVAGTPANDYADWIGPDTADTSHDPWCRVVGRCISITGIQVFDCHDDR